jgi:hypothetical protein
MRRFLVLFLFVALAMTVIVALPAAAEKPQCDPDVDVPAYTEDHPICNKDEPPPEPPLTQPCDTIKTLEASGQSTFFCEWTPENLGATSGTVTVEAISGEVSGVVVWVLDSFPGSICVLNQWSNAKTNETVLVSEFPLVYEDETYWEDGTNWCAPFDLARVEPLPDLNGDPLSVKVNFRVKKDTVVEISLTPGQAE